MFYEVEAKTHIRIPPPLFDKDIEESVKESLGKKFEGAITPEAGVIIGITDIIDIGEGIIIHGDGAAYYETIFKFLSFIPEMQEVIPGKITQITDFGAFMEIGPLDGMIHIGQTMDDYVSFSKSNVLTGKESKKNLKVNDRCHARIVAISYKDMRSPKIGLTMRQVGLGALHWLLEEEKEKQTVRVTKKTEKKRKEKK